MLDFFSRGLADPGIEGMLADIRHDLTDIAQKIEKEAASTDSPEIYFSTLRMRRLRPSDLKDTIAKIIELKAMADDSLTARTYPDSVMR